MQAGTLNKIVEIYRRINKQSESGEISKVREKICTIRCCILKITGNLNQDNITEYDKMFVTFQTWNNKNICDTDCLVYDNQEFRIILIDRDTINNTMKIYTQKEIK